MIYPNEKLLLIIDMLTKLRGQFPYMIRGIKIDLNLIEVTMNILYNSPNYEIEQNSKKSLRSDQEAGLDYYIKVQRDSDIRTANIVSDELEKIGVLTIKSVTNRSTGRKRKISILNNEWI